jgi:hypothetical protein
MVKYKEDVPKTNILGLKEHFPDKMAAATRCNQTL